ncbi:hypothetical protein DFP72DRAFT_407110 [Ephemerocybe angulata]|uniref:Uncharacterized protein n=1 Tax=Ephemerocybe angulata TaxID=980116 RepID=A0A8H6HWA3_9AGAR|nr:hypothetical protein DFP72DRAFT_407110 [Tulosesus angulatus]
MKLLTHWPPLDHLHIQSSKIAALHDLYSELAARDSNSSDRPWDNLRSLALDMRALDSEADWDFNSISPSTFFAHLPPVPSLTLRMPDQSTAFELKRNIRPNSVPIFLPPTLLACLTSLTFSCDWRNSHVLSILQQCIHTLEDLTVEFNKV